MNRLNNMMRTTSSTIRKTDATEKSSETSGTEKASGTFAGHSVKQLSPNTMLRSVLEQVSERNSASSDNKPISEYSITQGGKSMNTTANAGITESVLTKIGITKTDVQTLITSIKSSYLAGLEMEPAQIQTCATGAPLDVAPTAQMILNSMKETSY